MSTTPELKAKKTRAGDAVLKYMQDLNVDTMKYDASAFVALLDAYGKVAGELAIEEMVEQHGKQNWQSPDDD